MTARVLKSLHGLVCLAALLSCQHGAAAGLLPPRPGAGPHAATPPPAARSGTAANGSPQLWAPYQAEFAEVSGYLLALAHCGRGLLADVLPDAPPGSSGPAPADSPFSPDGQLPSGWQGALHLPLFLGAGGCPSDPGGAAGTGTLTRLPHSPAGTLSEVEDSSRQLIARLVFANSARVLPECVLRLFRPPRPARLPFLLRGGCPGAPAVTIG